MHRMQGLSDRLQVLEPAAGAEDEEYRDGAKPSGPAASYFQHYPLRRDADGKGRYAVALRESPVYALW
jgi:hypothetical protein